MQSTTKPNPCAQPNTIVSVSKPGASQNKINPLKIPSSTQESRLTQTNSFPGTGFLMAWRGRVGVSGGGRRPLFRPTSDLGRPQTPQAKNPARARTPPPPSTPPGGARGALPPLSLRHAPPSNPPP